MLWRSMERARLLGLREMHGVLHHALHVSFRKEGNSIYRLGHAIELWNTRPASRVETAATKFLHCVEQYHDAIKLRDDLENSHMWSAELRRMYDAMVKLRAALAAEGDHA